MKQKKKAGTYKKAYQKIEKKWEKEGNSQRHNSRRSNSTAFQETRKKSVIVGGIGHYGGLSLFNLRKLGFKGTTKYFENQKSITPMLSNCHLLLLFVDPVESNFLVTKRVCLIAKAKKALVLLFCPLSPELREADLNKLECYVDTFVLLHKNQGAEFTKAFVESIELPSLVGLDYQDINCFVKNGKIARIYSTKSEGKNKAGTAAKNLASKISEKSDANLFVIIHSSQKLSVDEINEVGETIEQRISKNSNVIWSARVDKNYKDKIQLYCITFFDKKEFKKLRLFEKINNAANRKMPECQTCEKKVKKRDLRVGHHYFCNKKCKKAFYKLIKDLNRRMRTGKKIPFDEAKKMIIEARKKWKQKKVKEEQK